MIDKFKKLELIQRSLGLRHKLKVHESMKQPDNHEDIALMLLAKWEFEDELRAIDEVLSQERTQNVGLKRRQLLGEEPTSLPLRKSKKWKADQISE